MADRVVTYIDGFNLYRGMIDEGLRSHRWLDLVALCTNLLQDGEELVGVRYFTARVLDDQEKVKRQNNYLDALEAHGGIEIEFGTYKKKKIVCHACRTEWKSYEEKKTDSRVAVRIVEDAFDNRFDKALIISGDSDMVPPIEMIKNRFPSKAITLGFPPRRKNGELRRLVNGKSFVIGEAKIRASRLPDPVVTASGHHLTPPPGW